MTTAAAPASASKAGRHPKGGRSASVACAAGSRVGMEYIGLARVLRAKIAVDYGRAELLIRELLRPLQPRRRFTPVPTHALMREVKARWIDVPPLSRLSVLADFTDGKLRLGETRLAPAMMKFAAWGATEPEPAIAVLAIAVICQPPKKFATERVLLADVGLHALARRFERGNCDDDAVLCDLAELAHGYRSAVAGGGDFAIEAGGGRWIGAVTTVKGAPVLAVRTFVA